MKCPVCKTEAFDRTICPECGFDMLIPTFISQADAEEWMHTVVEPYRHQYWSLLSDFEIVEKTVVQYTGKETNVVIPYGIEIIGEDSFNADPNIINVFLPDTVKIIGAYAFSNSCLETITLPQGLERIEAFAFESTNLRHIVIPGSCKVIEDSAFSSCMNLKTAVIMQGVTTLRGFAFDCCFALEYVVIPESLIAIEDGSLSTMCHNTRITLDIRNPRYCIQNHCLIDKLSKTIVAGFLDDEGCIEIPDDRGVDTIGSWAFAGQETEYVVTLPANIKEIKSDAFRSCGDLSIVLPRTIQTIGSEAFGATACNIFCEAPHKPLGWDAEWLGDGYILLSAEKRVYWQGEWSNCPDMSLPEQLTFDDLLF